MIKISKFIYMHWLFVLLCVFCYITRNLEIFFVSFSIMLIHELAHLIAAKCLGLSLKSIVIYPFGLNLRLNNTILFGICDEMILYFSGPLANIIMALIALPFTSNSIFIYDFYFKNIALFIINLMPIIPLDGGMIFKKLMIYKFGFKMGERVVKALSVILCALLVFFSGYLLHINRFNPSVCIFAAFILGNILVSGEKYNTSLLKELLYSRKKSAMNKPYKAKVFGAFEGVNMIEIAKRFNMSSNYFVVFTDDNNRVKKIMSEEEIINSILEEK